MAMTPTDQTPTECKHYGGKKKCGAEWFHGKCCLSYKCIRCPAYEPKEENYNGND